MVMFDYCLSGLHLNYVNLINDMEFLYVLSRYFPHIDYIVKTMCMYLVLLEDTHQAFTFLNISLCSIMY